MNFIYEGAVIGFEDNPEEELGLPDSNQMMLPAVVDGVVADVNDDNEHGELDQGDDELHEALRVLERAEEPDFAEEEPNIVTRSRTDANRFQLEKDADHYAEYVAMGWREPEPQDIGKAVFNRGFRRSEANLIRAKKVLRDSYISRHEGEALNNEIANIYFDQAMKTRPEEAQQALLKEVLKCDSKKIWHGKHMEDLTPEQRKLILPKMKKITSKSTALLASSTSLRFVY